MDKGTLADRWSLQNRKLRHLEGITLRNLSFSQPSTPKQSKTIDDESLPSTLRTPTKLLALREKKLEHSRSSSDLHTTSKVERPSGGCEEQGVLDKGAKPSRPQFGNRRRRSTLNWANAPPQVRQKKLEDVAGARLADTWFSLHCEGISEPIYVSEIVGKAMNFNFRFFDLNTYGPSVTRRDQLTIKIWARTEDTEPYRPFLELQVHLRSLQFIGKSVRIHVSRSRHLADGGSSRISDTLCLRIASSCTSPMVFIPALRTYPWMNRSFQHLQRPRMVKVFNLHPPSMS